MIPSVIRQAIDPTCEVLSVGDTSTIRVFTYWRTRAAPSSPS